MRAACPSISPRLIDSQTGIESSRPILLETKVLMTGEKQMQRRGRRTL